jgi:hypothetical protein
LIPSIPLLLQDARDKHYFLRLAFIILRIARFSSRRLMSQRLS